MYVCLHVCLFVCVYVCLYVVCLYACMPVLYACPVCLYVCMPVCLYACMPVCLSVCLSCMCVCPVCVSIRSMVPKHGRRIQSLGDQNLGLPGLAPQASTERHAAAIQRRPGPRVSSLTDTVSTCWASESWVLM